MSAVTMRRRVLGAGLPFVVLALAVLVHAALGPILACHAHDRDAQVVAVALAADAVPADTAVPTDTVSTAGDCPGCLLEEAPGLVAEPEPCTSDRPCQHRSTDDRGADPAVLTAAASRDGASVVLSPCPGTHAEAPALAVAASGPVPPPAVLSPVAVLCVDRN